ncbi:WXG100 family type VII secretion target [Streptomyces litchfieldiae]|uniref:WXG100 family type VII secretion target n=1 Tax=Streptomyces litchfieldiae TaxID=3075543 RepID=A0ABU2MYI5_9ACTN|nr:WXG100 family type VII secretion target [Streptomyces sp. DSM 44938]MDT0346684.1 WXG100 family type VII secretion target [Streptomyces sp. DSM 44938]
MDSDPAPGNPEEVRELAEDLQEFADDVGEALGKIRGMASDRAIADWSGLSADAFRTEFDGVPENLTKLRNSYDMAAEALARYWPRLENAQGMADRALESAIAAQDDLRAAQTELGDAQDWVSRAGDEAERLQDGGNAPEPPDEQAVRDAMRDHQAAEAAAGAAQSRVDAAEQRLAAARELAGQARELREEAARECARDIEAASDAGIQNRSWWEEGVHWVSENWDTIVDVCKVIVAVLGIVVMIIGGPLAWIVLAAALVVLADTLMKYARGEATLWDVAFAALDCIPGFKGLTTAGGLLAMARNAPDLLRGMTRGLGDLAGGARSLVTNGFTTLRRGFDGSMLDASTAARGFGDSRPMTEGVREALTELRPSQITRNWTSDDGHYYATRVFEGGRADGQTVFAGHGRLERGAGEFVVPEGTTISFYAEHGESLHGLDGLAVEGGVFPADAVQVFRGGDVIPDYTLSAPAATRGGMSVFENSVTVANRTRLSELLSENMGDVHWAACRDVD